MQNKLKNCPFCGGEAELTSEKECGGHGIYINIFFVECLQCGSRGQTEDAYFATKEHCETKAVEAWNRRVENG